MKIQGSFLVVMTTQPDLDSGCQAFKNTAHKLKGSYIIPRAFPQNKVRSIAIIPLRTQD